MFIIVLNSSNLLNDGRNNTFVYNFPNSVDLTNKYIAVSQITMYYSWFNISNELQNNKITYTWTVGATTTTYTINIPDGLYNIVDLNYYFQWVMIENGHYLINNTTLSNVYYFEFIINPNRYAIQLNTYQVPTSLPTGFSQPGNFNGYPTQTFNPSITIPANFNKILGYSVGFVSNNNVNNAYIPPSPTKSNNYVEKDGFGTLSYLSNDTPNVQPNSSIFLSISNINNPYSQPSSIIYSITPTVEIGQQIVERPPNFMWVKMINGTYNQLTVQFLGINKSPIQINDPNLTIILTIKDNKDNFLPDK